MQRRKFLKTGSLAAVAISLPASSLLAKPSCVTEEFIANKPVDAENLSYFFKAIFCSSVISDFANTPEEDRKIELSIKKSLSGEAADYKTYNAEYKIVSATLQKDDANAYDVVAERTTEKTAEFTPTSDVDFKKLKFTFKFSVETPDALTLQDKKGNSYLQLDKVQDDYYPEDCFLTTACVTTLGKPDNCIELTTLRNFRDNVLMNMHEGKELIEEYYSIAPSIVENINKAEGKSEIYLNIYNEMILPVMENIEHENYTRAVDIYRNYTFALKTKYAGV